MPSGLARRNFQAQAFIRRVTEEAQRERAEIRAEAPFQGFTPDLNPAVLDLRFAHGLRSFVERGADLVPAPGWEPLDADAVGNHGLPFGGEVNRIDTFPRNDPMASSVRTEVMVAVADTGTKADLWRFNPDAGPAQYQEVTATVADTGDLSFGSGIFPDSFVFSNGVPGTVDEPVFVLCNLSDNVKFYPDSTSGTSYEDLIQTGGSGPTNFKAKSGTVLAERPLYLHTEEGGTVFPRRLRYGVVGNAADVADASIGAGTIDAVELEGEGVLVRPLGDLAVGYFTDGIVFYHRTGNELAPLEIEYISKTIGVLSTHAVAPITGDLHFLVTNQGWFLLNATGGLREVGKLSLGGVPYRKWTDTWFRQLNWDRIDHIQTIFDPRNREVLVSFPSVNSTENDSVWRYRIDTDTVWPDSFQETGGIDLSPNSFALGPPGLTNVETWTESAGVSFEDDEGSWADLASQAAEEVVFHGTRTGFVMAHTSGRVLRSQDHDSADYPTCIWESPELPLGDAGAWKTAERYEVSYVNKNGPPVTLGVSTNASATSSLQVSRSLTSGSLESTQVAFVSPVGIGGTHHRLSATLKAPCAIRGMSYRYKVSLGEKRNL